MCHDRSAAWWRVRAARTDCEEGVQCLLYGSPEVRAGSRAGSRAGGGFRRWVAVFFLLIVYFVGIVSDGLFVYLFICVYSFPLHFFFSS